MAPVLTFSLFTIIAKVRNDQSLLVVQAFTSLTVLSLLGTPLVLFVQIVPMMMATVASFARIQEFLLSHSRTGALPNSPAGSIADPQQDVDSKLQKSNIGLEDLQKEPSGVSVVDGSFGWTQNREAFRNINFQIQPRTFVAVVGPVGSGKSTLLKAVLGETPVSRGFISRSYSGTAFCDQNAWIINASLRDNIVGSTEFDGAWYQKVLEACALQDLKSLPEDGQRSLGSKGIALSGGQKQRVVSRYIFLDFQGDF